MVLQFSEFLKARDLAQRSRPGHSADSENSAQRKAHAMMGLSVSTNQHPDLFIPAELLTPSALFPRHDGQIGAPGRGIVYTVTHPEALEVIREIHALRKENAALSQENMALQQESNALYHQNCRMQQCIHQGNQQLWNLTSEIHRLEKVIEAQKQVIASHARPFQQARQASTESRSTHRTTEAPRR